MVKIGKTLVDQTPVMEHYINYTPSVDDRPLEVLNVKKLADEPDKANLNYVSTIETQVDSTNSECDCLLSDYESNELPTGCGLGGIGSIFNPKIVTRIFNPQTQSHAIFYTNCEISELDSKFSTLTPNDPQSNESEYTKIITTKHTAKNHRSEIEINNCKLNSSASSTVSSSTSIVNDKKIVNSSNDLSDGKTTFRSNAEVNTFFDSNNSCNTNDEDASSDDYNKLSSSLSSFESIDKDKVNEQIAREMPAGTPIKYNIDKKRRGLNMKSIKKVFRTNKHNLRLPSDL